MHCRQTSCRRHTLPPWRLVGLGRVLCALAFSLGALCAGADDEILRVLKLRHHDANHPHRDTAGEYRLIGDFAQREGLTVEWIDAIGPTELEQKLRRGEGDIVIADLAPETAATADLLPSMALGAFRTLVYGRQDLVVANPLGLAGLKVAATVSSPLWNYLNALGAELPNLTVIALPDNTRREDVLEGINDNRYDAAIVTARVNTDPAEALPRIKLLFELSPATASRWHFAAGGGALRDSVDDYLLRFHTKVSMSRAAFGDLDTIEKRHVLRVITRVDAGNYFIKDGQPAGFEYELVREFATRLGLNVEFLIAESDSQVLDWLRRGIGDLVTTRINPEAVRVDPALAQSLSYFHSPSVILHRPGQHRLATADLAGGRVGLLANSMEHRAFGEVLASGLQAEMRLLSPDTPLEELARQIESNAIDAAVVDAQAVTNLLALHPHVAAGGSLPNTFRYAWTLRASDARLLRSVDEYLRDQHRTAVVDVLAGRYLDHAQSVSFSSQERISPYDDLVQRYADASGFDWRLIVAQMYLESKFDPRAHSATGARGLMQLQPATARSLGVRDPFDPAAGIRAGIIYLDKMRQRFSGDIAPRDRTWFALAAYNIGYAGVERARQRARVMGLDPTRWFGHVEQVMRLLAREDRRYRWGTTVNYVRTIRSLYNTYNRLQETLAAGLAADRSRAG